MADRAHTTGGEAALPFDLFDLNAHPDGELMRMCVEATKLLDAVAIAESKSQKDCDRVVTQHSRRLAQLHKGISLAKAESLEGWHSKALYALHDDGSLLKGGPAHHVAYTLVEDALRLGVLS